MFTRNIHLHLVGFETYWHRLFGWSRYCRYHMAKLPVPRGKGAEDQATTRPYRSCSSLAVISTSAKSPTANPWPASTKTRPSMSGASALERAMARPSSSSSSTMHGIVIGYRSRGTKAEEVVRQAAYLFDNFAPPISGGPRKSTQRPLC